MRLIRKVQQGRKALRFLFCPNQFSLLNRKQSIAICVCEIKLAISKASGVLAYTILSAGTTYMQPCHLLFLITYSIFQFLIFCRSSSQAQPTFTYPMSMPPQARIFPEQEPMVSHPFPPPSTYSSGIHAASSSHMQPQAQRRDGGSLLAGLSGLGAEVARVQARTMTPER